MTKVAEPSEADFDADVDESLIRLVFKPTNRHYTFYRIGNAITLAECHGHLNHGRYQSKTVDALARKVAEYAAITDVYP